MKRTTGKIVQEKKKISLLGRRIDDPNNPYISHKMPYKPVRPISGQVKTNPNLNWSIPIRREVKIGVPVNKIFSNMINAKPANSNWPIVEKPTLSVASDWNDDDEIQAQAPAASALEVQGEVITDKLEDIITLQMKLGKNQISKSDANMIVPLMVSLNAGEFKNSEKRASTDLVCAIDVSGSMEGEKINLLKKSFVEIISYLEEFDRLSIVIFNAYATRLTPLMCMNEKNKKATMDKVNGIMAYGDTNIPEGIHHALEVLRSRRYVNNVSSILVLTDGKNTVGDASWIIPQYLRIYEPQIKDTFSFNTFGFGREHDAGLMREIARMKNGNFYFIDELSKVKGCFLDCIGGLVSVIAQNVNITLSLDSNVKVIKAYGPTGFWTYYPKTNRYTASIPQLISDKELNYIFDVQLPNLEHLASLKLGQVRCDLQGLKETNYQKCAFNAECIMEIDLTTGDTSFDPIVMEHVFRVKTAEATNEARIFCENQNYNGAKKVLTDMKTIIIKSGMKITEMIVGLLKDIDDALTNIQPKTFKTVGRIYLMENAYVNSIQCSNLQSNVKYSNKRQATLQISSKI